MISEDRLRQAVRDAGALLDQSLPDPDQCHHTFSPAFLNRMEALLRRRKRAPVYRVLKGVACFFLAFLLGGTIFLSTNAQAREAFFGWLSEQIGGTVEYRFHNDVSEATHRYRLSEIPSGYWETDRYEAETTGDELYENEAGEYLSFSYQYVTEDAVQTGILPGHTGGRFHPRAPLSQTEAEAMALQVQRIMAGEGIPTFRCRLRHYDEDTMVQMLDPALRLRMVEGRVYACVRDLFQAEAQLRFQRGLSSLPPAVGYPARWSPRRQQVDLEKNMVYAYRAGWDRCLQGTRPGDLETHPDASTLLAPARLLFGELMVPVYDFRAKGKGHWHPWQGDWDPDSRTLTLNTYYPDGVGVSPPSPGKETPHAPVFLL